MPGRQIELATNRHRITLYVNSPSGVDPIDDYREVIFELPGREGIAPFSSCSQTKTRTIPMQLSRAMNGMFRFGGTTLRCYTSLR